MQVVININEDEYRSICDLIGAGKTIGVVAIYNRFHEMIANGTPLPKGHGRIADMDEAIKCIKDVEGDDAIWAINLIEWACSKRTIIEADNEVEE